MRQSQPFASIIIIIIIIVPSSSICEYWFLPYTFSSKLLEELLVTYEKMVLSLDRCIIRHMCLCMCLWQVHMLSIANNSDHLLSVKQGFINENISLTRRLSVLNNLSVHNQRVFLDPSPDRYMSSLYHGSG